MSTIVKPRFVLLQSVTNKTQFFYLVLMDLPADTDTYPNPSDLTPVLTGTDLSYTTEAYSLPGDYDGNTITYMLKPFMIVSADESTPNIKTITFNAKKTKKKGDTGGVLGKQVFIDPYPVANTPVANTKRDNSQDYICKDRCFVIQSDTNTSTYFVGTLVDYPTDKVVGSNPNLQNSNELAIQIVNGTNSNKTFLAMGLGPASYQPNTNPKTATYTAFYVQGYNTHDHKGILLFEEVDLYANAWQPEYGTVVDSI